MLDALFQGVDVAHDEDQAGGARDGGRAGTAGTRARDRLECRREARQVLVVAGAEALIDEEGVDPRGARQPPDRQPRRQRQCEPLVARGEARRQPARRNCSCAIEVLDLELGRDLDGEPRAQLGERRVDLGLHAPPRPLEQAVGDAPSRVEDGPVRLQDVALAGRRRERCFGGGGGRGRRRGGGGRGRGGRRLRGGFLVGGGGRGSRRVGSH